MIKKLLLLCFFSVFSCTATAAQPLTDENGLRFDEPKRGDVIGLDRSGYPIFLGGIPSYEVDTILDTEVYRGTKTVSGEFGTSGWIGNCTANAVAPNVVITAAHCKGTGARINFAHRESGKSYAGTCTRHPRYNTSTIYNDWALCKLDTSLPAGSKLVNLSKLKPKIGVDMYVNGFGAPNVGTHYWGTAKISSYSGNQDVVTCGPSNLGGGDSGGTLMVNGADRTFASIWPVGTGVNSRGNNTCSYYNHYGHSEFVSWVAEYEVSKGVSLCGHGAGECKPGGTDPLDCEALLNELAACVEFPAPGCRKAYTDFNSCVSDK